jgi:hypothetical protein
MEVVASIFLDALLAGAIALILCSTSREFEFFNLAAGVWVIVGGWIGSTLVGTGMSVQVIWFVALAILAGLQIGSPLIFRNRIREDPLVYLFVSLGTALVSLNILSTLLLESHGATIPLNAPNSTLLVFGCIMVTVLVVTYVLFHSHRWAKLVLKYRLNKEDTSVYHKLSALIGLEVFLLLLIGGASYMVHRGQVDSAQYLTLVPLLAVISTRMDPVRGPVVALLFTLAGHGLMLGASEVFTGEAAVFARPAVTVLLIIYVLFKSRPTHPIREAPSVTPLIDLERGQLSRSRVAQYVLAGVVITITVVFSTDLVGTVQGLISSQTAGHTLFVMALASIAWVGQQYFGVISITWPAFGLIIGYIVVYLKGNFFVMLLSIAAVTLSSALYFWWIRIRKNEPALVLDLAALMTVYFTLKNAPNISGSNEIVQIPKFVNSFFSLAPSTLIQFIIIVVSIFLYIFVAKGFQIRSLFVGMANLRIGLMNGVNVRSIFAVSTAILVALTAFASLSYHANLYGFLSLETVSIEFGLVILLFGYILHRAGIGIGLLVIALVFLLVEGLLSGFGFVDSIIGLIFILVPFLVKK